MYNKVNHIFVVCDTHMRNVCTLILWMTPLITLFYLCIVYMYVKYCAYDADWYIMTKIICCIDEVNSAMWKLWSVKIIKYETKSFQLHFTCNVSTWNFINLSKHDQIEYYRYVWWLVWSFMYHYWKNKKCENLTLLPVQKTS